MEELRKNHPDITIISYDQYSGTTVDSSITKAEQLLIKYGDRIKGIFAVCEPNATGVLGALRDLEMAGKVKFVAFDPNQPLIEGMSGGSVDGIVLQDPVKMGYEAVMALMAQQQGKDVEKRINTGEYVATPENMDATEMSKLLKPQQFED